MNEKVDSFKNRLKFALDSQDLRAVDLCRKTKISQSTMSQYMSGYAEPKKARLQLIADTLNVNPTWLMGLDVPMEFAAWTKFDDNCSGKEASDDKVIKMAQNYLYFHGPEKKLIENYKQLSDTNKKKVVDYSESLLRVQKMEEEQLHLIPDAAHDRTDIKPTTEMKKHDDDLMDNDEFWGK